MSEDSTASSPASQATRRLVAPELLPLLSAMPAFELNDQSLAAMRVRNSSRAAPLSSLQQSVYCEERLIPSLTGAPDVRLLAYTPVNQGVDHRPAYLHLHGGGFVGGSPEIYDGGNRSLAAELDCLVFSVDYRLAPETRFPGAVEDAYSVLVWMFDNAGALGIDRDRIAIGGGSAGAGHAAALALYARGRRPIPLRLQVLDAPMLDDRTGSNTQPHPYCGEFVWTPAKNRFGWRALLGREPGGADVPVAAVPARVADLAGLPTELHVIPGAFHGFGSAIESPQVQLLQHLQRNALSRAFSDNAPRA
jgi:acetyl esterase/lipase